MIAGLCALLFFWSRFLGGTSGLLEVLLFLSGIGFLLVELFILPGWGLAGFLGIGLLFVSVVMASNDFIVPQTENEFSQLLGSLSVILIATIAFLIVAGQLTRRLGYLPVFNRMVLSPPGGDVFNSKLDRDTGKPILPPHPVVALGDWGVAESLLRPAGRVRFGHKTVDVVSEGSFIERGRPVRVIEIEGNRVVVEEANAKERTA